MYEFEYEKMRAKADEACKKGSRRNGKGKGKGKGGTEACAQATLDAALCEVAAYVWNGVEEFG